MAGTKLKMARLYANFKKRKEEDEKKESTENIGTKSVHKGTTSANALTEDDYQKNYGKKTGKKKAETAKKPARKVPPPTKANVSAGYNVAMMLKRQQEERKKNKNKGK